MNRRRSDRSAPSTAPKPNYASSAGRGGYAVLLGVLVLPCPEQQHRVHLSRSRRPIRRRRAAITITLGAGAAGLPGAIPTATARRRTSAFYAVSRCPRRSACPGGSSVRHVRATARSSSGRRHAADRSGDGCRRRGDAYSVIACQLSRQLGQLSRGPDRNGHGPPATSREPRYLER